LPGRLLMVEVFLWKGTSQSHCRLLIEVNAMRWDDIQDCSN
jgi:hypothetical protein